MGVRDRWRGCEGGIRVKDKKKRKRKKKWRKVDITVNTFL